MSNNWKVILYITLAAVISFLVLRRDLGSLSQTEEGFFGGFLILGFGFLKLVLLIIALDSAVRVFRKKENNFIIPFLLIAGVSIAVITIMRINYKRNSSVVITEAFYDGDINGLSLKLRKNGYYEFGDYSILGGTCHYGKYLLEKDTIYLSNKLPRNLGGNKLLIKDSCIFIKQKKDGNYTDDLNLKLKTLESHNHR